MLLRGIGRLDTDAIGRRRALIYLSNDALRTDSFAEENGLFRQITHEPVGVVYVIVSALLLSNGRSIH